MKYLGCIGAAFLGACAGVFGTILVCVGCSVVAPQAGMFAEAEAADSLLYGVAPGLILVGAVAGVALWWWKSGRSS